MSTYKVLIVFLIATKFVSNFSKLSKPYNTFVKIVRGYEPLLNDNFEMGDFEIINL